MELVHQHFLSESYWEYHLFQWPWYLKASYNLDDLCDWSGLQDEYTIESQLDKFLKLNPIRRDKNDCTLYKINAINFRHSSSCGTTAAGFMCPVEDDSSLNPISTGDNSPPPRALLPTLLRNEKWETWPCFSLINGSQFALSNLGIDLSTLSWQWLKLRGFKVTFWKSFLNSDFRNGISNYQLVTLQTTEIQQFKFECFSMKTLKFRQDDVIIYDVSEDFRILLGIWNRLVKGYLCAKFFLL